MHHNASSHNVRYIGFWLRVAAYIIDGITLGLINIAIILLILHHIPTNTEKNLGLNLLSFVIALSYFAFLESSKYQATLGKMLIGAKVVDQSYHRISFLRAIGRHLTKIISALLLCAGFIMVAFTPRKQGLHDYIVKTFVIDKE